MWHLTAQVREDSRGTSPPQKRCFFGLFHNVVRRGHEPLDYRLQVGTVHRVFDVELSLLCLSEKLGISQGLGECAAHGVDALGRHFRRHHEGPPEGRLRIDELHHRALPGSWRS